MKIAWLSKKEIPKAYELIIVYITKSSDVRRLLAEDFFHAKEESDYIEVFKRQTHSEQYYKY